MTKHQALIATAILTLISTTNVWSREQPMHGHAQQRHSFSETSTRTLKNGETISRQTVQTATETGFNRQSTRTNAEGQTATKEINVVNDKDAGTRSRTMTGTTFDGKSYGNTSITQKTDDGFSRKDSFTTPTGKTGSREVVGVVNKEDGTVTKTVTTTKPNGETTEHSSTHHLQQKSLP